MQNLQETLIEILKEDTTYYSNEKLLKNKLTEDALKFEPKLIKYILSNEKLKKHFFLEVDGVLVFDKDKFIQFVNDKQFLPDSYTSFKNKIGLMDENGDYFREKKDVVLAWPYKDCVLEGGQDKEDQKRDEIFYNEILAPDEIDRLIDPKVLTNFKRYNKKGEHSNPNDISRNDNLIIKGNNLLALHSLLKLYRGKVKLIYIDPPYNTGSDEFGYNDRFNHSTWLTFMRNRLMLAVEFLSPIGTLWINIGDEECHYLKVLMDELMPQKYLANVIWQKRTSPDARLPLGDAHDHILVYAKDPDNFKSTFNKIPLTKAQKEKFKNPDNDPKGPWVSTDFTATGYRPNQMYNITNPAGKVFSPPEGTCWSKIESEYKRMHNEGRMWYGINGDAMPRKKTYLQESEGITPWTWWENKDVGHNQEAKHESKALFGSSPFSTPKPERLLLRIMQIASNEGELVLDFFAGSATTSAVAHKIKRRFIAIEQLSYKKDYPKIRLIKVIEGEQGGISKEVNWQGGGSFVYCELKKWNQNYIDEIEAAKTSEELLSIYDKMKSEAFFRYDVDLSKFDEKEFIALTVEQQKEVLIECLDKNHLYVNLSEMEDATYQISEEEKEMNRKFYGI